MINNKAVRISEGIITPSKIGNLYTIKNSNRQILKNSIKKCSITRKITLPPCRISQRCKNERTKKGN